MHFTGYASPQSFGIQEVAPGTTEALIATAVGLSVAIPAVVAYNSFAVKCGCGPREEAHKV